MERITGGQTQKITGQLMTGYMMYMILKCAAAGSGKQIKITAYLKCGHQFKTSGRII
jgi:hypothetical protein